MRLSIAACGRLFVALVLALALPAIAGKKPPPGGVTWTKVGTVQGTASMYASDFGDLKIMASRTQRSRDAFVIDPTKVKVATLRSFETEPLARIGDADTTEIYWEGTLEMCNANAHAGIFDLTSS